MVWRFHVGSDQTNSLEVQLHCPAPFVEPLAVHVDKPWNRQRFFRSGPEEGFAGRFAICIREFAGGFDLLTSLARIERLI